MSEQKKPKIDLKARLGKKTVAGPSGGPAIPPPVGIPKPPSLGGLGGSPSQPPPRMSPSSPYAPASAPPPRPVEPQAIKVEMSEEVVEQQKKVQKRMFMVGGILSLIVGFIGFAFGGSHERDKGAKAALEGAHDLIKEIQEADKEADKLNEVLTKAAERLSKSEYPEEEISALGGINIPFDGGHLTDKGIGRFRREVVTQLINYANTSQKTNEQKERIQSLLTGSKAGITELLAQKTDPKVRWSVIVQGGPGGPWASMQLLPAPFAVKTGDKSDWPADFQVKDGKDVTTVKRFKSGDPTSGDPQFIPVNPLTEASVCPSTTIVRLRQELVEMQTVLKGDNTPGQEKTGLLQMGDQVIEALKKIGNG
jgi:hypothetical protein